jgi:tetratricopeptide (TPR) repeat protein
MIHSGHKIEFRSLALAACLLIALLGRSSAQAGHSPESLPPGSAEAHLGKGYSALKEDRYEVAAEEFRAALAIDPKLTLRARFPLGVALFEMHKRDEARQEFETVQRETGDHPNVRYYLGRIDLEEGKFPAAIANFTQAMTKPPFPDTSYYLGFSYFKQGDLDSAEKWLKQAVEANPDDARMQYQLGLVYRKQGREDEAKKTIALSEELRRTDNQQSTLRLECAQKLESGPRDEAHALCDKLYDPDNADKLTALGTIYAQHGDLNAALKPLQRAAELNPQSPQTQYNLALAYYQLNRFPDARAALSDVVVRWPDIFQLNALYGAVLTKLGENELAYKTLQHAHQLNSQDPAVGDALFIATVMVARKYQATKNYPEALRYYQDAAQQKPQEPEPHRGMAEVYALTGKSALAASEKETAEKLAK